MWLKEFHAFWRNDWTMSKSRNEILPNANKSFNNEIRSGRAGRKFREANRKRKRRSLVQKWPTVVEGRNAIRITNHKEEDRWHVNLNAITNQIARDSQGLATIAEQGLDLVDLSESFHIKSIQVTINNADSATAMVRANGSVTLRKNGGGTHSLPNFWKTIWRLESGQWKLAEATRLNPVNGTEMGYFSAQ